MATDSTSGRPLFEAFTVSNDMEIYVTHFDVLAEIKKVEDNRRRSGPRS